MVESSKITEGEKSNNSTPFICHCRKHLLRPHILIIN